MLPYKKIIASSGILAFVLLGIGATNPPGEEEPDYKNLKVVSKKIGEEDMEKLMHSFNVQLGVKCMYCHKLINDDFSQGTDWASDEKKEKRVAREMLKMTMQLNQKYFDKKMDKKMTTSPVIWCTTCHRGFPRPPRLLSVSGSKNN